MTSTYLVQPTGRRASLAFAFPVLPLLLPLLLAGTASAQVSRVSTALNNLEANGASSAVAASADGRFVAFISDASNLVPGDTNNAADIFVKDRQTGIVTRVNVTAANDTMPGLVERPSISADGRYVAFATTSALVPEDTNICTTDAPDACKDIYLFDRNTSLPSRLSVSTGGTQGDAASFDPHISGDGRYIVFRSAATTLVANATGIGSTVYIRDRQDATTTRAPVPGALGFFAAGSATISGDGQVVVFSADDRLLNQQPIDCTPEGLACIGQVMYVHTRGNGQTTRYSPHLTGSLTGTPGVPVHDAINLLVRGVSSDGQMIAYLETHDIPGQHLERALVSDRTSGRGTDVLPPAILDQVRDLAISGDGRWAATCTSLVGTGASEARLLEFDLRLKAFVPIKAGVPETLPDCDSVALTPDGLLVFFASPDDTLIAGDANARRDVFVFNTDSDGDGLPSSWETLFGLDPNDPADAAMDADGDGLSNAQEYADTTHPNGAWKRYFAEGAANAFFETTLDLMNPNSSPVTALLTYLGSNGRTTAKYVTLASNQHVLLLVYNDVSFFDSGGFNVNAPDQTFSTVIESTGQLVAERTMAWPAQQERYGSHAETAIDEPRTEWHFAEGATSPYSLYYLLENPNATPADVTITYMLPAPLAPITRVYTVGARTRLTIDVGGEPGLAQAEVAGKLSSTLPILAERAMYLSSPGQLYGAGHDGAAIASPATEWFIAEGATGFFSLYYTISNPSAASDAEIVVTYLLPDGSSFQRAHTVAKEARLTIDVAGEDPRLLASEVSASIASTNGVPVVAERVMWWPRGAPYEASLTAGTTETGRRWGVASAPYYPGLPSYQTYLLVANPSDQAGTFTVTLRSGVDPVPIGTCVRTFDMPAHSRTTVDVPLVCEGVFGMQNGGLFSGTIESSGPGIVAERSTYLTTASQFWTAGASVALTKLPVTP